MKVTLVVLNNFLNDNRVFKEACTLQNNGYEVKVVALHEGTLKEYEVVENIPVYRIKVVSKNWSKRSFIQAIKYIEFLCRFFIKFKKTDIVHCNDLNTLPLGCLVKIFYNWKVKIIYDAHEYEINQKPNQSKISIFGNYLLEKLLIRFCDRVMTVSNSIADEYVRLYGIDRPVLVLNCPVYDPIEKKNLFRQEFGIREDQKVFLYQGGLGWGRGIERLLDVFSSMKDDRNVCIFMGYGPLEKEIKSKAKKSNTIFFKEAVSRKELMGYTSSADFGLCFIEAVSLNNSYCLPNKLFEYLMAGIPILNGRSLQDMSQLVEAHGVGIVVDDSSSYAIVKAISKLENFEYDKLVSNVYEARKQFSWHEQEKILLEVYGALNHV